jgi:hypothetical protein
LQHAKQESLTKTSHTKIAPLFQLPPRIIGKVVGLYEAQAVALLGALS